MGKFLGEQRDAALFYKAADVVLFPVTSYADMVEVLACVRMPAGDGLFQREYCAELRASVSYENDPEAYAAELIHLLSNDGVRLEYAMLEIILSVGYHLNVV